jgi:hypothetical protein
MCGRQSRLVGKTYKSGNASSALVSVPVTIGGGLIRGSVGFDFRRHCEIECGLSDWVAWVDGGKV